ncbi:hypothetical protein EK599_20450 [Vibrio sp. T187]|uniref:hypothetical protein n=1 Tax=Vibrio TaxID=662 RepID=UPI0010C98651|nr:MULTISPECIES: hypothetical protein [Vibrio]MBW3698055.1 hypothetical protein [Vibrio sp. T187]
MGNVIQISESDFVAFLEAFFMAEFLAVIAALITYDAACYMLGKLFAPQGKESAERERSTKPPTEVE